MEKKGSHKVVEWPRFGIKRCLIDKNKAIRSLKIQFDLFNRQLNVNKNI